MLNIYGDIKQGERGAWISICAYLFLTAVKISLGYMTGSKALAADGLNNSTDIVVSIAVLIGLRISRKPPDENHPYGHFRAETIAALVASLIMAVVGLQVFIQAVKTVITGEYSTPDSLAAWVAIGCAACMYAVYRYNRKLALRINNNALMAAAQDNRSDALVSIGVAVGIIGAQLGLPWLDPITAVAVSFLIVKTAWEIFRQSSHSLSDGFDAAHLDVLRPDIQDTPGVIEIKDLKARVHGSTILLDVVVTVDPQLTVSESHEISDLIEQKMIQDHQIMNVHVHIEPAEPLVTTGVGTV